MVIRIQQLFLLFFFNISVLCAQADISEIKKEIDLVVGMEKIITFDFLPSTVITIANESLVTYKFIPQKNQILLTPTKPGETTLTVRDVQGDIKERFLLKITSTDQSRVLVQLKDLLGDVEGLEIGIKGDAVYVGGQIVVPSDIGRVVVILERFPDVLRLVELSPQTQLIIARKMQEEMHNSNLKDVTVRVVNGSFWIEGIVNSEKEQQTAEQIARAYLPDQIQNLARRADAVQSIKKLPYEILLTINKKEQPQPLPKLFKITTQFVELTKSYDKAFGFSWTPMIGNNGGQIQIGKNNGGVTTSSQGTLAATISNLFPKLNSAKSAGYARVIQSAVIVTSEKVAASISKRTTIPYEIGSGDYTKAGSATAGLDITVTPSIVQEENIKLVIGVSVRAVDGSEKPTEFDNSIKTEIVVKSQESAVVGGVVSSKFGTDYDKDPPVVEEVEGGLPLFSFLKSKKYTTNRSQFVVFITPEIIESAATATKEIEKKFRKRGR